MIGKNIVGYEDAVHKTIRLKMEALGNEAIALETQPQYANALRQKIARLGYGYTELNADGKKSIDREVKEATDRLAELLTPEKLREKIEGIKTEIAKLENEYYETPYQLPPLHLQSRITYSNRNGIVIKTLEDNPHGTKLHIYEDSSYTTPNVTILTDDKNRPIKLKRQVCNSETLGKVLTFLQDVFVDTEVPTKEPEKPKTVTPKPVPKNKDPQMKDCPRCKLPIYKEMLKCPNCNFILDDSLLKVSHVTESKGLITKLREKL